MVFQRRPFRRLVLASLLLPAAGRRLVALLGLGAWAAGPLRRRQARQRRLERSLRLSEALFQGVVSNAFDAIISVDDAQRITLFNRGAERIFGYSADEVLGQPLDLLIPEEFRSRHRHHVQAFDDRARTARQMGERLTVAGLRKGGEVFPAEASIMRSVVDGMRLLTVMLRDITARSRAEEVLRNSEELFRTAFENAPIGMALVSLEGGFLHANSALCELVGYSRRELLSKTFQDITHPSDLEPDLTNVSRLLEGVLGTYQMEKRYFHKQGHVVSVLLTCSLVRGARGEPLYFVGQIQDISESKRLERALRFLAEAGPRLADSLDPRASLLAVARMAVPSLADWCVVEIIEEDGQVSHLEWVAASEEKSRLLEELFATHPHVSFRQGHLVANVMRTGRPVLLPELSGEVLESTAEDAHHLGLLRQLDPRSLIVVPLLARERILGTVILLISRPECQYDAHDLELAEELARRAGLAIDNAFLHARTEQAIRLRDEVLRVVAHDLRAPLQVVSLSSEVLLRRSAPGERTADQGPLGAIRKAVERANRLIQDLLDVARMEAGHLSVVSGPRETALLLQEAAELHRELAREKSILLSVEVPDGASPILADRDRVLQIFSNLLGNALKFTPNGGRISLRAWPLGDMMCFSVSDTGPGISGEELPHLFEPFWQARKGHKQGAGLGLAIARGLVDAHGGRLWAESEPGLGSTFYFTLPRVMSADEPAAGQLPAS
ncbi:PAS domain S-box protein [Melittangium boletus]|uniref:histidine kinase n=1 Tax=Melittangium boletus DSM 14713 TaxID=1294270 RepID=A0A250ID49_9BACT|nr:PAS domain S-box protein [Melittangium boletus]ATB29784.1 histidine kinase [Melittangium boletus DSM 14713]